jgi:hypothetical protein
MQQKFRTRLDRMNSDKQDKSGTFTGKHADVTEKIIQAFYTVYNQLGYGFSEKVYQNALALELAKLGLQVEQQKQIAVYYDGQLVGEYFSDMVGTAVSSSN